MDLVALLIGIIVLASSIHPICHVTWAFVDGHVNTCPGAFGALVLLSHPVSTELESRRDDDTVHKLKESRHGEHGR